jgi:hypothetical protein
LQSRSAQACTLRGCVQGQDHPPPPLKAGQDERRLSLANGPLLAWTAKANKRVQFGYGLNHMIDVEHSVIIDVEAANDSALTQTS